MKTQEYDPVGGGGGGGGVCVSPSDVTRSYTSCDIYCFHRIDGPSIKMTF